MARLGNENLFLLEFLIDDLELQQKCTCGPSAEVCVSFQFLDNQPLDVCEGDFEVGKKFAEEGKSKTGKSCLFSLNPAQAQNVLTSFDIIVSVFKKMEPGWQPDRTCIGTATVSILAIFWELMNSTETTNSAKVLQDNYKLLDSQNVIVGNIGVYIRLSCYGKMIVTQFQMNMSDKSVLFKDKDGHSLYRYKKSKKGKTTQIEDVSKNQEQQCVPACPPQQQQQQQQQFNLQQMCPPQQQMYQQPPMPPQNLYPPPNLNCPTTPCYPGGYGQ